VQVFWLVALAHCACMDEILHHTFHVREMEVAAESMQGALDAFMPLFVDSH
jgi:hypothetical protein